VNSLVWLVLVLACCLPGLAQAGAAFGEYTRIEFAPFRNQTFEIPFRLDDTATVAVSIFTPDQDLIRTVRSPGPLPPGSHTLAWDGKDEDGTVVPDEAYILVLTARLSDGTEQRVDPRQSSGGEVVEELRIEVTPG
jgi:hypothetical protein